MSLTREPWRGDFNPRSPCGERRLRVIQLPRGSRFQSTLPVRGATQMSTEIPSTTTISIHAPRAGSDKSRVGSLPTAQHFNPRSPCGERLKAAVVAYCREKFQSTLPVRGATSPSFGSERGSRISIHAPRAGSDHPFPPTPAMERHFNPRSPCGERRVVYCLGLRAIRISIHAPRAGSDRR